MDVILADGDIYIVEGRRVYENELFANLRTFCDNKRREFEAFKGEMQTKLNALRGEKTNIRAEKQDDMER